MLPQVSSADKIKKQTQDLLQAELCNTLKRRKPVVIAEPPKYQYPTYNENNSTKLNESSNIDKELIKASPVKTPNVSAVLSVVTGIKLPDIQYDAKPKLEPTTTVPNDKPKIAHAKPNFTINRKESASKLIDPFVNKPIEITKVPLYSTPSKKEMLDVKSVGKPQLKSTLSVENKIIKTDKENANQPNSILREDNGILKSYGEVSSTLKKLNATKSKPIELPIERIATPAVTSNYVANKKAIFEQSAVPSPLAQQKKSFVTKTMSNDDTKMNGIQTNGSPGKIFDIHRSLNRTTSAGNYRSAVNTNGYGNGNGNGNANGNVMNKNESSTPTKVILKTTTTPSPPIQPKATLASKTSPQNDFVDHNSSMIYRKQPSTLFSSTKTYETKTKNFEQKTIVSFSKDLLNAPNNHPEEIRVTKTIYTHTHTSNAGTGTGTGTDMGTDRLNNFRDIRFSIGPNAHVVPKPK